MAQLNSRTGAELDRVDQPFRLVVEASPAAMIMVGRDGRIVLVNTQTEKLFGYSRGEMLGHPVEILVPGRLRDSHKDMRAAFCGVATARQMGAGRDLFASTKDGREVAVEIGLNPIETTNGDWFVLAAVVDITERKQSERRLLQYAEKLAHSNHDLEQFAYISSHDLQEPLRAITTCVELLQERIGDRFDEAEHELFGHVLQGTRRMRELLDDLLTYSRVSTQAHALEPTNVNVVVDEVLSDLRVLAEEKHVDVSVELLPVVLADPPQLRQLFQNLLSNALKFSAPDRRPQIQIGVQRRKKEWEFSVADNGIGIDSEHFGRIFEAFQRLHTQEEHAGSGIGLTICKRVVERHGGTIRVESKPGCGSIFRFTLPVTVDRDFSA